MVNSNGKQGFKDWELFTNQSQHITPNDAPPVLNDKSFGGAENTLAGL
jgi:hypothetical protein